MLKKIRENLFYYFIFLLPWQVIFIFKESYIDGEKFQSGTLGIYFFELILFIWIILNISKIKKYQDKKLVIIVFLLAGWSIISITWSENKYLSIFFSFRLVLGTFLFLILQRIALNFKKITFAFISSATLGGILGIFQFVTQSTFSSKWLGVSIHSAWQGGVSVLESGPYRLLRAYGEMSHPNIFGGLLSISLILGLGAYFKSTLKELRWRLFLLMTIAINFLALLTTFSRSSFLAFSIGTIILVCYFFYIQGPTFLKKVVPIFFIIIFIGSVFSSSYSDFLNSRVESSSRLEKKSLDERAIYIGDSKMIISKKPILGTGMGNYLFFIFKEREIKSEIWKYQPVHNLYLLIFSELGIVGFSLFLLLIILIIWEMFIYLKEHRTNKVIFSTIFISLLVLSFFDHWCWTSSFGIFIFWLILGFSKEKDVYAF